MSCKALQLQSCEVAGSTFQGRKFTFQARDITGDTFTAKVRGYNVPAIELTGVKTGADVYFSFSELEGLKPGKYIIQYWAEFEGIGREIIASEDFTVSSQPCSTCTDSADASFVLEFPNEVIEYTVTPAIMRVEIGWDYLTDEQKAELKGPAFTYDDFTPEQLDDLRLKFEQLTPEQKEEIKGDDGAPFTFEMFTEQQLESLRGPKGDPFTYDDFTQQQIETLQHPAIEAAQVANQAAANALNGINDVAVPSSIPSATGFKRYIVHTAGTYTNFKNASNVAIVVSAADLAITNGVQGNDVILEVKDNVAEKIIYKKSESINGIDNILYGEIIEIIPVYMDGAVSNTGSNVATGNIQRSDFIPVNAGEEYDISASDASSRLAISAYSSANADSFIANSSINRSGAIISGEDVRATISIPSGVNFIRVSHVKANPPSRKYVRKIIKRIEGMANTGLILSNKERLLNFYANKKRVVSRRMPTFSFIWDGSRNNNHEVFDIFQEFGLLPSYAARLKEYEARINIYRDLEQKGAGILVHNGSSGTTGTAPRVAFNNAEALGFKISGMVQQSSELAPKYWPEVKKYYGYAFVVRAPLKGVYDASLFNHNIDPCEMTRIGVEEWNKDEVNQTALKAMVDFAIVNNLLVNFYGHGLPSDHKNTDGSSVFTQADLRAILLYIKEKQDLGLCKFRTTDDAVREYYML